MDWGPTGDTPNVNSHSTTDVPQGRGGGWGTIVQDPGPLDRFREVVIYDYVDADEPLLAKMASKREAGYKALGYEVMQPGDLFSRPPDHRSTGTSS
jgi:hypothetical protein